MIHKNEFIHKYKYTKNKTIASAVKNIERYELHISKDLSTFTLEDIRNLFIFIQTSSIGSCSLYVTLMKKYYNFLSKYGIINNSLFGIKTRYFADALTKQPVAKIITKKELQDNISKIPNPVDRLPLLLIFNNIKGENYSELTNLKKQDVNFNNSTIKVNNRIVSLDTFTMEQIKETIITNKYHYRDTVNSHTGDLVLVDNDYLLRPIASKEGLKKLNKNEKGRLTQQAIQKRMLSNIKLVSEKDITVHNLYVSGILHQLLEYSKAEDRILTNKEVRDWVSKHNYSITKQELYNLYKVIINH